jgi:diazepam-binding inhibitor (GABA receptor modulator, acyl-CoA-binding protein)
VRLTTYIKKRKMEKLTFESATKKVKQEAKKNPHKHSPQLALQLYGLYKQATEGDAPLEKKPSFFSFDATAKAKWEAWNEERGKTSEQAKKEYVDLTHKWLL